MEDSTRRNFDLATTILLRLRASVLTDPVDRAEFDEWMRESEYELALNALRYCMQRDGRKPNEQQRELFLAAVDSLATDVPAFNQIFDKVRIFVAQADR